MSSFPIEDISEADRQAYQQDRIHRRAVRRQLMRHPDPLDPDHPEEDPDEMDSEP